MLETPYLVVSLILSSIGLGYVIYGKKQKHKPVYYCGIALILLPYAVTDPTLLFIIGVVLLALPKMLNRLV